MNGAREKSEAQLSQNQVSKSEANQEVHSESSEFPAVESPHQDDTDAYPGPIRWAFIFAAQCSVNFIISLDETVIATAIPSIANEFDSLRDIGWYGSAYLLTLCTLQLLFGKLCTLINPKSVFLFAVVLFEIGSIVCASAPNSTALILGRLIAGAGYAATLASSLTILALTVRPAKLPLYTSLIGGIGGISWSLGPFISGQIIGNPRLGWRWIFWINPMIGVFTLVTMSLALRLKPKTSSPVRHVLKSLDLMGFGLAAGAIVCLLLALELGGHHYAWGNARVIVLFILSGICLASFWCHQRWKGDDAMVPPQVLALRGVLFGALFTFCCCGAQFVLDYYIPLFFQVVMQTSAQESGVRMLAYALSFIVFITLMGLSLGYVKYLNPPMYLSTICLAVGCGLLSTMSKSTSTSAWIGYQVLAGAGAGMGNQLGLISAQTTLEGQETMPIGVGIVLLSQYLGGTISLSIAQDIFSSLLASQLHSRLPSLETADMIISGAIDLKDLVPPQDLSTALDIYDHAISRTFYVAIGLASCCLLAALGMKWSRLPHN